MTNTEDENVRNVQAGDMEIPSWNIRTTGMPEEMRILLNDYPRDAWQAHPGFKNKTMQWLGAHRMFRQLSAAVRKDTEAYLDGKQDPQEYIGRLSYRGGAMVNNLHGHHGWEDYSYFPELSAADSRFDAGLAILEKDHETLHQVLDKFTQAANRVINLVQRDNVQVQSEVGKIHSVSATIETLLQRHLSDEEELAVPIILHHRLRG